MSERLGWILLTTTLLVGFWLAHRAKLLERVDSYFYPKIETSAFVEAELPLETTL